MLRMLLLFMVGLSLFYTTWKITPNQAYQWLLQQIFWETLC